jgi:hypothetical protein
MNRKLAPLFILSLILLNACGGGSGNSTGGGGTGSQPISVSFSALPPQSMTVGDNVGVSATVTNDSANAGVNWSCTPTGACGTFTPTATASGANTTYVAPGAVPSGGKVMIVATSVTDSTKNAQAPVTINALPPPVISVSISTAPAATLPVSGSTTLAATTNDTAGVTWSCAPAGSCGLFNPPSTASTTTTTYTAPASVPSGGTVTLTATSVTDPTKFKSSSVLITGVASNASLKGQYAFIIHAPTGNPTSRGITTWLGSIAFDGAGNVPALPSTNPPAGGIEDIVSPKYHDEADPILATVSGQTTTTHYAVDASGHGTLLMLTQHGETLNVSFVVTSPKHAVVIELDGEPGSGTFDLQTPPSGGFAASQISGGYSFTMVGVDAVSTPSPYLSFGGTFSFTTASNVTSLTGLIDINTAGLMSASEPITGGQVDTAPDPTTGRGVFHIVVPSPGVSRTFIFYMVSPKVLRFTEQDAAAFMGGSAYAQGAATTTLSGSYVYQHSGWNPASANPPTGRTVGAGQFSVAACVSTPSSCGFSDANTTNPSGTPATTGSTGLAVSNLSYSIPATLNGTLAFTDAVGVASTFNMYVVDPTLNILDPNSTTGGGGALLLHTDTHINGTGILVPQQTSTVPPQAPIAFLGNYALNLNNSIATMTPDELDLVGVLAGDGNAHFGGAANFALADYDEVNSSNTPVLGAPLSGGFQIDQGHPGRAAGSFTVNLPAGAVSPNNYPFIPGATIPVTLNVALYQVSNSESFVVETDTQANVSGYLIQQLLP